MIIIFPITTDISSNKVQKHKTSQVRFKQFWEFSSWIFSMKKTIKG